MFRRTTAGLAVALAAAFLLPCCTLLSETPPFRYISARLTAGERPGCHHLLGIEYRLLNSSPRDIVAFAAAFCLYETGDEECLARGTEECRISFEGRIAAGSEAEICTSLDSVVYYLPSGGLVAEQFRVTDVTFSDGTSWRDAWGTFVYPYPVTFETGTE